MKRMLQESWQLYAIGSAVFAGMTAILVKIGVSGLSSDLATLIRTLVVVALTAVIVTFRREWAGLSGLRWESVSFLVYSGVATGLSWLCYFRALQLGPVSRVAPVDKLSVMFAIVLSALFLGETIAIKTWIGALLVLGGTVLIALPG